MPLQIESEDLNVEGAAGVLAAIDAVCHSLEIPFFLVGALARDILMHHLRGGDPSPRLTRDVDVAVAVETWAEFDRLVDELEARHEFERTEQEHRLKGSGGVLVDIVPFGAVEDEHRRIRWPSDSEFVMSVVGYREAHGMTEAVVIDGVEVQVIALRAYGPLKVLAWEDRRTRTTKDAEDLCYVLRGFWEAEINMLAEEHTDLFEAEEGDTDFIGARAYGREAARFVRHSGELRQAVEGVISRETADVFTSKLAEEMGAGCMRDYERRFEMLVRFRRGLEEASLGA